MSPSRGLGSRADGGIGGAPAIIRDHQPGLVCLPHVAVATAVESTLSRKMGARDGRIDTAGEVSPWRVEEPPC
jgi:hypothetical protein